MKYLFFIFLSFLFLQNSFAKCSLIDRVEQNESFQLSNGTRVLSPTKAQRLETFSIFASINTEKIGQQLKPHGLFPVTIGGKAMSALSLYQYHQSDLGNFNRLGTRRLFSNDLKRSVEKSLLVPNRF